MSSSRPSVEDQAFPVFNLDVFGPPGDSERQRIRPEFAGPNAVSLGPSNESLHADGPRVTLIEASPFADFRMSHPTMEEDASIIVLPGGQGADMFAQAHRASISSIPELQASANSIITAHFPGMGDSALRQRSGSNEHVDEASPYSNANGSNALEEPIADEFGLSSTGPGDGTDLGGRSKEDKTDTVPSWSELKTKAGKERKRLPLACIACRRKKIRCSGEKPACKHCIRSRTPCVYKVTTRKAAPRTDYMAMLDKRLKRMEERIIKIVPKSEQESVASVPRAVVKPAIPGMLSAGRGGPAKKRGADEAFGADLDHWARAPSKPNPDSADRPATLMEQETEEGRLLLEGAEALPSKDLQEHLAEVFFENIYGQAYHLLHKPSYMRKLRAGTLPPVLILSVCAVAARFSTHPKLNTTTPNFLRGEEWASRARDIVTKHYEWPNLTILTCLLILGLHEFGTCHGGRSWALGGQATRMAFALQLHKDVEHDTQRAAGSSQLSFTDREIRRRTMWACFLMDRFNSSGTDRPTFVREEFIKIQLPIKEKYFQLDMPGPTENLQGEPPAYANPEQAAEARDNLGVAAYMIRAIAVWGRVINYLNQGGKESDPHPMWSPESEYAKLIRQTEDVLASLPPCMVYGGENLRLHDTEGSVNQFVFLHISIQQNILFMNRFAVSSPSGHSQQDVPKTFVTKAGAKAFAAANRISELLKDAEAYLIAAPFVGYCAFLSSTVHIFGIFSGNPAIEATSKRNLATNVKFLAKMKRFWGMFHWMSENLREQYRTCADAARQGTPANENSASPIFQYGDWFDRYPHGVSQSDFVDPASYKNKGRGDEAVLEQKPELHTVEEFFTTLLSPQSAEGAGANTAPPGRRPPAAKRKSVVKKPGGLPSRQGQQQLEPLVTDFKQEALNPEQVRRMQPQQRSFSFGGQGNGAACFNPLAVPHSATGPPYHALSPISPVAMNPFGHHPSPAFYNPDLLGLSLHQQAATGMLPQLDRQLVFGAYAGMDPAGMHGQSLLAGMADWGGNGGGGAGAGPGRTSAGQSSGGVMPAADASSAWFMPFNMEPPELGQDMGGAMGNMDGFGGMFGSGGMSTPSHTMGGLHHGNNG